MVIFASVELFKGKKLKGVFWNCIFKHCLFCLRIYKAPPTAELEPLEDGQLAQTDEVTINHLYGYQGMKRSRDYDQQLN